MKHPLTRIGQWSQELLAEVISAGDLVVDLTAGTGKDTLFLYQLVGVSGQVVSVDIQLHALETTRSRLETVGATSRLVKGDIQPLPRIAGIYLVQQDHANIATIVPPEPQAIIANLGFYPDGDHSIITQPQTTVMALQQSCEVLAIGGRLAVMVYPWHQGGEAEGLVVSDFFSALSDTAFHVVQLKVSNRPQAPFLFVAEKIRREG